jgi:hypothetical protein
VRCFSHQESKAVGIGKNCGRGVCVACVKAVDDGLSCSTACEARITALRAKLEGAGSPVRRMSKMFASMAVVMFVFGLMSLWLHSSLSLRPSTQMMLTLSDLMLVMIGIVTFVWSGKIGGK